ncbi:MAG: glycosyltransferase family 39 protein [Acidimicrobiales bacterium]|nr:glycosyltransferase family 39 protein [Acidimicrobiales bacterium]
MTAASVTRRLQGWWSLIAVVAVAGVARAAYGAFVIRSYQPNSDAFQYYDLARNIGDGLGFSMSFSWVTVGPTAFRPPAYPYLLAGAMSVFGESVRVGQVLNLLIGLVVVALAWLLARRLGGPRAAAAAGLTVALYPPLIANDVVLLTEPLSLAALLGALLALTDHRWALAGLLTGLLILTRPSAQFLVVLFALWMLWQVGWRRALGLVGVTVLVVTPWVARNWVVMGSPLLVTSNGFNLAAMYSSEAQQADRFVDPANSPLFDTYELRLMRSDEVVWTDELRNRGLQGIRDNPTYVAKVVGRNILHYLELTPWHNEFAEGLDGRNLEFRRATLPLFYLVTAVGWFGLVVRRRRPDVVLLIGVALYFMLSSIVFVAPPRLRAPFDLICCIGVGLAWAWWRERGEREQPADDPAPEVTAPARP